MLLIIGHLGIDFLEFRLKDVELKHSVDPLKALKLHYECLETFFLLEKETQIIEVAQILLLIARLDVVYELLRIRLHRFFDG